MINTRTYSNDMAFLIGFFFFLENYQFISQIVTH